MGLERKAAIGTVAFFISHSILYLFLPTELSYTFMAYLAAFQLLLFLICAVSFMRIKLVSFSTIFYLCSCLFHYGQILLVGFDIPGKLYLDFRNYATMANQTAGFKFCLWCHLFLAAGIYISENTQRTQRAGRPVSLKELKNTAMILAILGILPRLYIDISLLMSGITMGYLSIYQLYIPQFIYSLAFFWDAGCIMLLYAWKESKKQKYLFWGVLLYDCLMMMSGVRMDKVTILIVWGYLYYFILNDKRKNKFNLIVLVAVGLLFLSALTVTRSEENRSITQIFEYMKIDSIVGDILGEFGSTFDTLLLAVSFVPGVTRYGMGASYLAGLLAVVPTLVQNFPSLDAAARFLQNLPNKFSLGGSYLGEIYYNFSWAGIFALAIVGYYIGKIDKLLKSNELTIRVILAAVIAPSALLFIRGYFSDFSQKIIWVMAVVYLVVRRKRKSRMAAPIPKRN